MGFDVSAGILVILGPTVLVWPLCIGQDFRLRFIADELANGPSPIRMASKSESTAEAMESGRSVVLVLQVFL